ncbi:fungal-specific transcription factor domain-containing protein [Boeremia exigua]|uniref:fungal-specific transcription factor domain-containing protein n=1 Tax=Boeremia exigua TaxID=749465 RepID=UPI001E8DF5CF|nr:fungal-specific transcription factor domain-containing protein [Boeremia exigua]KAH6612701.1 fungal-specific transcription factor domain-containing protein [Boeremia exigua]
MSVTLVCTNRLYRPCKARKVKCGEEKPNCLNCERQGEPCDYNIRLNWGGRTKRDPSASGSTASSTGSASPYMSTFSFGDDASQWYPPTLDPSNPGSQHSHSLSRSSPPRSGPTAVDPELVRLGQSELHRLGSSLEYQQDHFNQTVNGLPVSPAPFQQTQFQTPFEFSSLSTSAFEALAYSNVGFSSVNADAPLSPPSMLPPRGSAESMYKRHKSSHSAGSPATTLSDAQSPYTGPPTPYNPFVTMPLTPNSSVGSEEPTVRSSTDHQSPAYPPPDLRRLSVQSLVNSTNGSSLHECNSEGESRRRYPVMDSVSTTYGYDMGLPDFDTPRNKDDSAIAIFSPPIGRREISEDFPFVEAEPRTRDMAFGKGGYYVKPVQIRIPKSLEPLPPLLMENKMNLLYFHHFINHTARILVPHDCERNPFRQILPEMAVRDDNIMNLLLAYSASHRARMLNQPEPSNRIAVWVQDVFPKLRQSLTENPNNISNSTLAAVIMMASLEIIASNTFEVPISWQSHLQMARQMVMARGGPQGVDRQDRVAYFLSRWFAYLDVLGSLSGNKTDTPLGSFYWSSENASADEEFEIDCLMGFTNRCVGSLARISELAKLCEPLRIDDDGNIRDAWQPGPDIYATAMHIRNELEEGLSDRHIHKGCNHRHDSTAESEGAWDATEIYATNEMFHWGGLVHLYRRVLGKPATDPEVQNAIREIVELLYKVRRGSSAEACLLFPMFVAGCDAQDEGQREKIMDRLRGVEGFGMTQIDRAKCLMQQVWETGKPWESLVSGEFFG